MKDRFGRQVDTLRISVTDRCNLRCRYCAPVPPTETIPSGDILSFDEIESVARPAARLGFTRLRLTGGEPLLRPRLEDLVSRLARVDGILDLALTTNGTLLARHARSLRAAGLMRVNVSLDAVEPARYAEITRGGDLEAVLRGIDAALGAGLRPVKLNCVVDRSPEEPDARGVAEFARRRGLQARFIPRMDLERGLFSQVIGGRGGDCPRCDRLRLSCHGLLLPCLFSEPTISVRALGAERALRLAVAEKPEAGGTCSRNRMYGIGG